ncbi:hypothetical protein M885DRAFT_573490 [Pelagophyceae sp. CCMP2097]|nr:hypothetical protein M885DRAFT_573490 [Pelagophyceae sp. CCMP2097]
MSRMLRRKQDDRETWALGTIVAGRVSRHGGGGAVVVVDGTQQTAWLPSILSPVLPRVGSRVVFRLVDHRGSTVVAHGEWHEETVGGDRPRARQKSDFESKRRCGGSRVLGVVSSHMVVGDAVVAVFLSVGDLQLPIYYQRTDADVDAKTPPPQLGSWWSFVLVPQPAKGKHRWAVDAAAECLRVPAVAGRMPGWIGACPDPPRSTAPPQNAPAPSTRAAFQDGSAAASTFSMQLAAAEAASLASFETAQAYDRYAPWNDEYAPQRSAAPAPQPPAVRSDHMRPPERRVQGGEAFAASGAHPKAAMPRFSALCALLGLSAASRAVLAAADICDLETLALCTEDDLVSSRVCMGDAEALAAVSAAVEQGNLPSYASDPISFELIVDPVVASDGFTYDRASISAWFQQGRRASPLTNEAMASPSLETDFAAFERIRDWARGLAADRCAAADAEARSLALEQHNAALERKRSAAERLNAAAHERIPAAAPAPSGGGAAQQQRDMDAWLEREQDRFLAPPPAAHRAVGGLFRQQYERRPPPEAEALQQLQQLRSCGSASSLFDQQPRGSSSGSSVFDRDWLGPGRGAGPLQPPPAAAGPVDDVSVALADHLSLKRQAQSLQAAAEAAAQRPRGPPPPATPSALGFARSERAQLESPSAPPARVDPRAGAARARAPLPPGLAPPPPPGLAPSPRSLLPPSFAPSPRAAPPGLEPRNARAASAFR